MRIRELWEDGEDKLRYIVISNVSDDFTSLNIPYEVSFRIDTNHLVIHPSYARDCGLTSKLDVNTFGEGHIKSDNGETIFIGGIHSIYTISGDKLKKPTIESYLLLGNALRRRNLTFNKKTNEVEMKKAK